MFCSASLSNVDSQWIGPVKNKIDEDISRTKKKSADENLPPFYDYTTLKQMYPELSQCSFFHPSAQVNLTDMGDCVDQEVAMSRRDKEIIETYATQQEAY